MTELEIKKNFAKNLRSLRLSRKMNQIQLGEKLNYTSKAVSKWENGDVLPDVSTLKMIADFFTLSIDELISTKNVVIRSHRRMNRFLISLSSTFAPFVIATLFWFSLSMLSFDNGWLAFCYAAPVSGVVAVVFSSIWYRRVNIILSSIYLILCTTILVLVLTNFYQFWISLIVMGVLILTVIVFFSIRFPSLEKREHL